MSAFDSLPFYYKHGFKSSRTHTKQFTTEGKMLIRHRKAILFENKQKRGLKEEKDFHFMSNRKTHLNFA